MLFRGFSISLIVLICTLTTSANAEVTVTLSDRMARAFDQNGVGAKTVSKRLNDEFNLGLKELGKTNPAAKALFESGQTIRIVCAKGKEAKDLGIDVGVFAPAETVGDFNKDGSPKQGGTAVIGIRCKELQIHGLDEEFYDIDPRSTGFKILIHELLHATNKARRHPPDKLEDYHEFVDKFVNALESAKVTKADTSWISPTNVM